MPSDRHEALDRRRCPYLHNVWLHGEECLFAETETNSTRDYTYTLVSKRGGAPVNEGMRSYNSKGQYGEVCDEMRMDRPIKPL